MSDPKLPQRVFLKDYHPPSHLITEVSLEFDLDPKLTRVRSLMHVKRHPEAAPQDSFFLNGCQLKLESLRLNGTLLDEPNYILSGDGLSLHSLPESFELEVVNTLSPENNQDLQGMFVSSGSICTQCEAEGFRRITFFPDRPDIMTRFKVTVRADKQHYPVLLSNGNQIGASDLPGGRHQTEWEDPFPKPCYLFAVAAGELDYLEEIHTTTSGRRVPVRVYSSPDKVQYGRLALETTLKAMRWDEEVYGREYDLERFHIAVIAGFNGAMENKGLNLYNSKIAHFNPRVDTDEDYRVTDAIVGHEYLHNWTGNRVTCRDWFQLSVKEGLTTFRHWQFAESISSAAMRRIWFVRLLRSQQFTEDAGPMAHSVCPDSYIEINNFYTPTVYKKGAEVIRMLHTLMGKNGFRRGMDLYFERHDGQAVTKEDFLLALADANKIDLSQFSRWYTQVGTPTVNIDESYDAKQHTYTLEFTQSQPLLNEKTQAPLQIPVRLGLLDNNGGDLPLQMPDETQPQLCERLLVLTGVKESFTFTGIRTKPVTSLFRHFSAPVKVVFPRQDEELAFLIQNDNDHFNRWDAADQFAVREALRLMDIITRGEVAELSTHYIHALRSVLGETGLDPWVATQILVLPEYQWLSEQREIIKPQIITEALDLMRHKLAEALFEPMWQHVSSPRPPYSTIERAMAKRALRNQCLSHLVILKQAKVITLCLDQVINADNMTDSYAALKAICQVACPEREKALDWFFKHWRNTPEALDKWFEAQARSRLPGTLDRLKELAELPEFDPRNPSRVRSLLTTFVQENAGTLHAAGKPAYRFLADQHLRIDGISPYVAAYSGLLNEMMKWRRFDDDRQLQMRTELERVFATPGISAGTWERVEKGLQHD